LSARGSGRGAQRDVGGFLFKGAYQEMEVKR